VRTWIINLVVWVAVALAGAWLTRGQTVTLAWDASPSAAVAGYRVYYGTNAGSYAYETNAGPVLTQAVVLPHGGRWFFAATAYDTHGLESDFSNEVSWDTKPTPPVLAGEPWVRVAPVLERSANGAAWGSVTGVATWYPATNGVEFFRMNGLLIERVLVP
jgi:hypothetical protein